MALEKGLKIGPYEILSPLGSGGMGEVYRARDTRLGRDVAIKVLPYEFADHPERVRRFEQEARAVAALNHPNILSIYDVGEHEGAPYLVTELLEGESLREMLVEGAIPVRRAIDIGSQVAEGLAAAHEKGIVHRDLKPGNVFVTKEGRAKILDFGLARLVKGEGDSTPDSRAPTADPGTKPGVVLGTMGYMSPEQVKGRPADARSDIFSLGVMLHEMLTGERVFKGDSDAEIMTAILKEDPAPLSELDLKVPPVLERTIVHCLEKNPDRRFQSARDIGFALESVASSSSVSVALPPLPEETRKRRLRRSLIGLGLAGMAAALLGVGGLWAKHEYDKPAPAFKRVTFRRGTVGVARFTPDNQSVVYQASWEGGKKSEIYVQRLASPDARSLGVTGEVVGAAGGDLFYLKLSPSSHATLCKIPLEGGTPRELLSDLSWADCDKTGTRFAVVRVDKTKNKLNSQLEYPVGRILVESEGIQGIGPPRISPDGSQVAFTWTENIGGPRRDVRIVDSAGRIKTLVKDWVMVRSLAWSPDGKEIWFTGCPNALIDEIHAVSLSGRTRLVTRLPGRVKLGDISPDGRSLVTVGQSRFELRGRMAGDSAERDYSWLDGTCMPALSPDGAQMVFQEMLTQGSADSWTYHWRVSDVAPKRISTGTPLDFSPDWKKVLVGVETSEGMRLRIVPTGAGESKALPIGQLKTFLWAKWHPDGKRVVMVGMDDKYKRALFVQNVLGGPPRFLAVGGLPVTFTPDGRYLVALSRKGLGRGMSFLYYPMEGGEPKPIPFLESGDWPIAFTPEGRSLFVRRYEVKLPIQVDRLDLETGKRVSWLTLAPPDLAGAYFADGVSGAWITPDGRYYMYGYGRLLGDLYEVEGLK